MLDLIIRGGTVVDGTSALPSGRTGDSVGLTGGVIAPGMKADLNVLALDRLRVGSPEI